MAALLNAIFGSYPDVDQQNNATNQITVEGNTANTTERLHTSAIADDIQIKSVISSETQASTSMNDKLNIDNLLSQLSTTHAQVDQYSRARTAAINEQVQRSIANVLTKTQRQQEELLVDANRRHLIIDNDYKLQLQKAVEALDAVKATKLADLEHDLHSEQQVIMTEAKQEIDVLNDQANAAKLHALVEAQEQASKGIAQMSDQMAISGQLDTHNLLQSTTTTIITSQAQAAGDSEVIATVPATETTITTKEQVGTKRASDLTAAQASSNTETRVKSSQDNTAF